MKQTNCVFCMSVHEPWRVSVKGREKEDGNGKEKRHAGKAPGDIRNSFRTLFLIAIQSPGDFDAV